MQQTNSYPRCPICGLEHQGTLPGLCVRPGCGVELLPGRTPRVLRARTFRLLHHYSLCILPFSYADLDTSVVGRRVAESKRWQERVFSRNDPEDVDRTEYFLPYIRRFLFPSLYDSASPQPHRAEKGGTRTCLHYSFDQGLLGNGGSGGTALSVSGTDPRTKLPFDIPLMLDRVELLLFSYRVGFLTLQFRCSESEANFFNQMDALSSLRAFIPLYQGFTLPEISLGAERFRMPQMLAYLLNEFTEVAAPDTPAKLPLDVVLPVKPTFDDRMMVYSFSCLDKETILADPERCRKLLERSAIINFSEESNPPSEEDVSSSSWMRLRRQGYSKDGCVLVVFNTDRYHDQFLGLYHGTYYFDVFLLAVLQRVTLLSLFERFSDIDRLLASGLAGRRLLKRVRRDLLLFKNQCWFSQITNKERGLVLWKKWQSVFENQTLLQEVNEQSGELNMYLENRHRERTEWLVRLGSFLGAGVSAIFGLEQLLGQQEWVQNLRWPLLATLTVGTVVFGWYVLFWKTEEK